MADHKDDFAYCLDLLRRSDRDRYLACLLVPETYRGAFAALYAFNAEIARIRDVVRDPLPGELRMQWWRDLANGTAHGAAEANPLASALLATIEAHALPRATFDSYIEARTFDLYDDPMPDRTTFEGYAGETVSAIIQLCALVIAPAEAQAASEAAGHAGVALAVAGAIMLLPLHSTRGQVYLPGDILSATGLDRQSFLDRNRPTESARAIEAFADFGREHLKAARTASRTMPRELFAAFLPVAIAGPVLDRAAKKPADVLAGGVSVAQWRRQWMLWRAASRRRF